MTEREPCLYSLAPFCLSRPLSGLPASPFWLGIEKPVVRLNAAQSGDAHESPATEVVCLDTAKSEDAGGLHNETRLC